MSLNSVIPLSSISLALSAVIAKGTSSIFSSRFLAVTTISSTKDAPSCATRVSEVVKVIQKIATNSVKHPINDFFGFVLNITIPRC